MHIYFSCALFAVVPQACGLCTSCLLSGHSAAGRDPTSPGCMYADSQRERIVLIWGSHHCVCRWPSTVCTSCLLSDHSAAGRDPTSLGCMYADSQRENRLIRVVITAPADGPALLGSGTSAGMVMIVFGSQIIHTNGLAPASTLTHRERESV